MEDEWWSERLLYAYEHIRDKSGENRSFFKFVLEDVADWRVSGELASAAIGHYYLGSSFQAFSPPSSSWCTRRDGTGIPPRP